jgi:hypothetical protein
MDPRALLDRHRRGDVQRREQREVEMRSRLWLAAITATALAIPAAAQDIGRSSGPVPVEIVNFPDLLTVQGEVAVKGPVLQTSLTTLADVLVSPVKRDDTNHLVDAGTITTDGFVAAVVSVLGEVKGQLGRTATVGAILLPDEEHVLRAFTERGQFLMSVEVKVDGVTPGTAYFASSPAHFTIAYPRYHVFLYNTGDKTVAVTVHAYMTQ